MSYRIPATSPDFNAENSGATYLFDLAFGREVDAASGAIAIKEGTVALTGGSAQAMTLAVPTAGAQSAGGDDFRKLTVLSITAQAHTITTPSNGINGADHIATYGAAAGNFVVLTAYNGVWWELDSKGITLS